MARSTALVDHNVPPESLESVLRVGQVRLRPYKNGNVKHAHVALKKVDEEEYEDAQGRKRMRGVFSLFAQKVINVKPGKEIFFSVNGYLQERVVAFEADISNTDEVDVDVVDSAKSEETVVQRETQALPPKLRKMWSRKESVVVKQNIPIPVTPAKASVGVQAVPLTTSVDIQTTPTSYSNAMHAQSSSSVAHESRQSSLSVEMQAEVPSSVDPQNCLLSSLVTVQSTPSNTNHEVSEAAADIDLRENEQPTISSLASFGTEEDTKANILSEAYSSSSSCHRSLSPMDLDSAPTSPEYSPNLLVADLPLDEEDANAQSCVELKEVAEESQLASPVTLVELSSFKVKEEPEDIILTPLPPARPKSYYSYRAPTFVPARHNPLQEKNDGHESDPLPIPTSSKVTLHPKNPTRSILPAISVLGTAPAQRNAFVPSALHPARSAHTATAAPSSCTPPTVRTTLRGSARLAPTFVPATQLSQSLQPPSPRVLPLPLLSAPPKPVTIPCSVPSPPQWHSPALKTKRSKKRKRTWAAPAGAAVSDTQVGTAESPSKKWKPIKPEPQSPILPIIPAADTPLHDREIFGPPELPPLALLNSPPSVLSSAVVSKQEQREMVTPAVKFEPMDSVSMSLEMPISLPPLPAPSPYLPPPRPFVDLTHPQRYQNTAAYVSLPWKPPQSAGQHFGGASSSLPVIRTAQIKMDGVGRETGVRAIVFDSTGDRFAVICRDNTIRIWDNLTCSEIAKLAHNASVVSAVWLEGCTSIASMGSNGIVSKWSLVGKNRWIWERLLDSGDSDPSCLAYYRHLLAIANPRRGIKIWECKNGTWFPLERDVPRKDILSIKFVNGGNDLLCGSSDGTVFRCTIPRCRVQPVTTFKTKVFHVDVDPSNTHALVAQACGSAHLVELAPSMNRHDVGRVLQDYSLRNAEQQYGGHRTHAFGPLFTDYGDAVVFGSFNGRVLVWDRRRGRVIHEMDHGNDVSVQAVASFDGEDGEQHLVSSTRYGLLTWWRLPIRIF